LPRNAEYKAINVAQSTNHCKTVFPVNTKYTKQPARARKLSVLHQNIAGVLNKTEELEVAILELENVKVEIDVLCLTETFLKKGDETNLLLNNYKMCANFCRDKHRRGGSCILSRKALEFSELDICKSVAIEKHFEACAAYIKCFKILVICVYRTPDSDFDIFLEKLDFLLSNLKSKSNKIIIGGDFNIDFLTTSQRKTRLCELLSNYGFKYHISQFTRLKTCIDNILSNIDADVVLGKTHQLHLSDHDTAQTVEVNCTWCDPSTISTHYFKYGYDFSLENTKKFAEYVNSISFQEVYETNSTQTAFNFFHDLITLFFKLCFPLIKIKINLRNKNPKWITKGIRKSCKVKRSLRQQYYLSKTTENKNKAKLYSKCLKKIMYYMQRQCNKHYILNSDNKCKASWNIVKQKIGSSSNKSNITEIKNKNNITLRDGFEIANTFNNFFIECTEYNNQSKKGSIANKLNVTKTVTSSIFLTPTTPTEMYKTIMSLKNRKSTGYDDLTTQCLKSVAATIANPLAYITNLSLEHGDFPERLKLSIIKPLHKKGVKNDLANYRPIALVPILSKVFEKIMYSRILGFLEKHEILTPDQYGFRKNKSTALAGFTLVKYLLGNINTKSPTSCLFLDLSKAFDFVDHEILLSKLYNYGIRGTANKWLQKYLRDRQQVTRIAKFEDITNTVKNYDSDIKLIKRGTPQGSILSPLLFLIYINDFPLATNQKCILFADDATIMFKCSYPTDAKIYESSINNALNDVISWLLRNNLQINTNKTNFVQFSTIQARKLDIQVHYREVNIKQVNSVNFLGLHIDQHLSWKVHVDILCGKLHKFVYALKTIKHTSSIDTAITVYHAYVCSLIRYGIILWGNSPATNKVFVAQKKCLRAIWGLKNTDSCRPLFLKHKLLTVPAIYVYEMGKFVKQNVSLFELRDNRNKRAETHLPLNMPGPKVKLYRDNCYYMAVLIYNSIPLEITSLPVTQFCKTFKVWLTEQCIYTTKEFLTKSTCRFNRY
jgi:exonuclease III